jgi:hypothetical protein
MNRVFEKEDKDGDVVTKEKRTQANENSENAAVKITKSSDHEVNKDDSNDDDPALILNRVESEGGTVTEITRQSADQSSAAASEQEQEAENKAELTQDQQQLD